MGASVFAELGRRRVFRALVGYGVAAFAVLQVIEPIMHGLHWPDAVLSYVVVALALGFPIVVTLAWIFDVRGGRVERTLPAPSASPLKGARLALLLVGIGLLAATPGVVWYFVVRGIGKPAASQPAPSIAVLPFVNLSSDKENEYFSDGMTEEIINALANVEGLRVVARTSAFSFKGKNLNVRKIGEELNVATVLEGSVRRQGNQIRIAAQLIGVADGYHLWSNTYDRELSNVFSIEDELARSIVQALRPKLVQTSLVQRSTASMEAHDLYLKGRYFLNQRSKEGLRRACALFEQAIAIDAGYALAHSGLADCYSLSIDYAGERAARMMPKAKLHSLKALELDDGLAEAHASAAHVSEMEFDWNNSERELRRAIELRPGYATAHHWYALNLAVTRRLGEAREEMERARQLDPTSVIINAAEAMIFYHSRDYGRAVEQAMKALELDPGFDLPRVALVHSYSDMGRFAEALAVIDQAPRQTAQLRGLRAEVLALSGDREGSQRLLDEVEQHFGTDPLPRGTLARTHLALGERDAALLWLERGVEERDQSVVRTLGLEAQWDPLKSDPRFQRLIARARLR